MEKCLFEKDLKVWSVAYGWGKIKEIEGGTKYPVRVLYNKVEVCYTFDGKEIKNQIRTLFFEEIVIPKSALEKPRKTAKEMLDECEELEFSFDGNNYYIYTNGENKIRYTVSAFGNVMGVKYISRKDAERIVRECKENN